MRVCEASQATNIQSGETFRCQPVLREWRRRGGVWRREANSVHLFLQGYISEFVEQTTSRKELYEGDHRGLQCIHRDNSSLSPCVQQYNAAPANAKVRSCSLPLLQRHESVSSLAPGSGEDQLEGSWHGGLVFRSSGSLPQPACLQNAVLLAWSGTSLHLDSLVTNAHRLCHFHRRGRCHSSGDVHVPALRVQGECVANNGRECLCPPMRQA